MSRVGLNLIVAAVVLWNTVYLDRAVDALARGVKTATRCLTILSPLGWEHVAFNGDYVRPAAAARETPSGPYEIRDAEFLDAA